MARRADDTVAASPHQQWAKTSALPTAAVLGRALFPSRTCHGTPQHVAVLIYVRLQRLAAALNRISDATTHANALVEPTVAAGAHVLWELSPNRSADDLTTLDCLGREAGTRIKLAVDAREELVERACRLQPDSIMVQCTSSHGQPAQSGAELREQMTRAASAVGIAKQHGIKVSLCIPPERAEVETAHLLGAYQVSLHAGEYTGLRAQGQEAKAALDRLNKAAVRAHELGLELAVGHGLTLQNASSAAHIGVVAEIALGEAFARDAHALGLPQALAQVAHRLTPRR